ncbi:hypothetical protein JTE90_013236 [Oedothorax gibbosus]|uniref:Uncharacterized protein n=1 Tax=Oedothorax gibbosus TaxID=931172 RepID=A0AAV6VCW6_9ARAC|nr:hypothetical protein JTE90_013236 [Oedothorax gibbosus]
MPNACARNCIWVRMNGGHWTKGSFQVTWRAQSRAVLVDVFSGVELQFGCLDFASTEGATEGEFEGRLWPSRNSRFVIVVGE